MTNEEYFISQLWQLKHVFFNEAAAIKNSTLEYIAFTDQFASEFNLDENSLGSTLDTLNKEVAEKIKHQELDIISQQKSQDTIYHFNQDGKLQTYIMRKKPLINPTTKDVLGIIIFAKRFDASVSRKLFVKQILGMHPVHQVLPDNDLSEQQQQIITCLLLGFHHRKEIASILANITDKSYSEARVKNELQTLYQKFKCNSPGELLNLIVTIGQAPIQFTGINIPEGSHTIK